jgi:drug/metabolite transporter (DMT)-like permease
MFSSLKTRATDFIEPYKEKNPATYAAAEQAVGAILIADGFMGTPHPMGGKGRAGIFGTISGMVIGIIFMLVPTFFGNITGINNMTATTSATVVSVGTAVSTSTNNGGSTCPLTASYTVNGTPYMQQSSADSSSACGLVQGQTITINYDPANPGSWMYGANTIKYFLWIFFFAGLFSLVSSIILFFIRLFSIIFGWKLLKDGRKNASTLPPGTNLQTMVDEIKQNFTASVFGFGSAANPSINDVGGIQP